MSLYNGQMTARGAGTAVLIGCVINGCMGILYVWSLFSLPIETALNLTRAEVSLAPSLALGFFTFGMVIHKALIDWLGRRAICLSAFVLAGGGHLLFGLWPVHSTLLTGYGVLFGLGAGLGYGVALSLAGESSDRFRAVSIGLVTSCFALCGVVMSIALAPVLRDAPPKTVFTFIGLGQLAIGMIASLFMPRFVSGPAQQEGPQLRYIFGSKTFLSIGLCFFVMCFAGLMAVAHITGILRDQGLPSTLVDLGPGLLTSGYILGSLTGGKCVDLASGRRAMVGALLINCAALLGLLSASAPVILVATFGLGMVFGSTASLVPMTIGEVFGTRNIGMIFGYMMIAYGIAGITAPWVGGLLYTYSGSYSLGLMLCVAMTGACFATYRFLRAA